MILYESCCEFDDGVARKKMRRRVFLPLVYVNHRGKEFKVNEELGDLRPKTGVFR